jgi:hypothetical protein
VSESAETHRFGTRYKRAIVGIVVLVLAAAATSWQLDAHYQPLTGAGTTGAEVFLPNGHLAPESTADEYFGDNNVFEVSSSPNRIWLMGTVLNNGPYAVTITGVNLAPGSYRGEFTKVRSFLIPSAGLSTGPLTDIAPFHRVVLTPNAVAEVEVRFTLNCWQILAHTTVGFGDIIVHYEFLGLSHQISLSAGPAVLSGPRDIHQSCE